VQATMAKVQHDGAQVTVTCTDQPLVAMRSVQLQLRISNLTISMAEAVCLQKALGIVLGGG
jgi:hypothetical protein